VEGPGRAGAVSSSKGATSVDARTGIGAPEGAELTERLYEGLFLLDSNEAAKGWSDLESHMTGLLEKHSARLQYSERWPDQRLATEIKGVRKGTYFLTYFTAPTTSIAGLRADIQLSDRILRFLAIQEDYLEEEMNRRREQASRKPEPPPPAPEPAAAPTAETATEEAPAAEAAAEDAAPEEAAAPEAAEAPATEASASDAAEPADAEMAAPEEAADAEEKPAD